MKNNSKTWEFIFSKLKSKWYLILLIVLFTVFSVALNSLSPLVYKAIIDNVIPSKTLLELSINIIILIAIPITGLVVFFFKDRTIYFLSDQISQLLRKKSFSHCLEMQYSAFEKFGVQKLLLIITRSIGQICDVFISGDLIILITNVIQLTVVFVILSILKWQIALLCLSIVPFSYFIIKNQRKKVGNLEKKLFGLLNKGENFLLHSLVGIKTIRSYNGENYENKRFQNWLEENKKIGWKIKSAHSFTRSILPTIVQQIMFGVIFIISVYYIKNENMTIGSLIAVLSYVPIVFQSINELLSIQIGLATIENSTDNLDDIFNSELETGKDEYEENGKDNLIQFSNVTFSYGRDKFNIVIPSLIIHKGEFVAIIGESGGGKSSVFDILCKFHPTMQGEIFINGQDIKNISPESLRNKVSFVSQEVFLWNESILNNIIYPNETVDMKKFNSVIKATSLNNFINNLPAKEGTILSDFGSQLSGGERQRIAIARALYKDSDIILLDEPTSALDSISSKLIFKTLMDQKFHSFKTIVMITHDVSKSLLADKVIVIKDGKIAEQGSPSDLLKQDGNFTKLLHAQSNGNKEEN